MWKVTGAAGEPAGSVMRLGGSQTEPLILFRECGEFTGGWVASPSGSFLGMLSGFSQACLNTVGAGDPTPAWMAAARSYRSQGNARQLLSGDGRVLAQLLPTGKVAPRKDMLASLADPPTLSAGERRSLDSPAKALPAGAPSITPASLAGRWRPYPVKRYATPAQPLFAFTADGKVTGSDGCNKLASEWKIGPAGEIISISGPFAGVGCTGPPIDAWIPAYGRAAVSGDVLTFYARNGRVLGRLTR
jgi:hypothetical protein